MSDNRINCSNCPLRNVLIGSYCEQYCSEMADFIEDVRVDERVKVITENIIEDIRADKRIKTINDFMKEVENWIACSYRRLSYSVLSKIAEKLKEKKK